MAKNQRANQVFIFFAVSIKLILFLFNGMISLSLSLAEAQDDNSWLYKGKTLTDSDLMRSSLADYATYKDRAFGDDRFIKHYVCMDNLTHSQQNIIGEAVCRSIGSHGFEGRIRSYSCTDNIVVLVRCLPHATSLRDCRVFTDAYNKACCNNKLEVKCASDPKPPKKKVKLSTGTILGIVSACLTVTGACCSGGYVCCKYKILGDAAEAEIRQENERMEVQEMGRAQTTAPLIAGNDTSAPPPTYAAPPPTYDVANSMPSDNRV